jgi:hypothetical protein
MNPVPRHLPCMNAAAEVQRGEESDTKEGGNPADRKEENSIHAARGQSRHEGHWA